MVLVPNAEECVHVGEIVNISDAAERMRREIRNVDHRCQAREDGNSKQKALETSTPNSIQSRSKTDETKSEKGQSGARIPVFGVIDAGSMDSNPAPKQIAAITDGRN